MTRKFVKRSIFFSLAQILFSSKLSRVSLLVELHSFGPLNANALPAERLSIHSDVDPFIGFSNEEV